MPTHHEGLADILRCGRLAHSLSFGLLWSTLFFADKRDFVAVLLTRALERVSTR